MRWKARLSRHLAGCAVPLSFTIRAVLSVVENLARSRRLAARADIVDRLAEIGTALLLSR